MLSQMAAINIIMLSLSLWDSFAQARILPLHSVIEVENTQATVPEFTTSDTIIRARPHVKNHEELLAQCKYFPTRNLQDLCRKIAENPIIGSMTDTGMVHGNLRGFRIPSNAVIKSGLSAFGQEVTSGCPDSTTFGGREMSLSPWKLTPNFDQNRYPQLIPEAKCRCKGCIDMRTGKENPLFVSSVIKVKVRFLRINTTSSTYSFRQCTDETCFASDEDVSVGCHCVSPKQIRGV